jgi:hypothetical protein
MNLPPRALQALVDLKGELLASSFASNEQEKSESTGIRAEPERRTPERRMRHARQRSVKFQRMCQLRHHF